jgi:hypothetical protein
MTALNTIQIISNPKHAHTQLYIHTASTAAALNCSARAFVFSFIKGFSANITQHNNIDECLSLALLDNPRAEKAKCSILHEDLIIGACDSSLINSTCLRQSVVWDYQCSIALGRILRMAQVESSQNLAAISSSLMAYLCRFWQFCCSSTKSYKLDNFYLTHT